jgi:hypothetical protein
VLDREREVIQVLGRGHEVIQVLDREREVIQVLYRGHELIKVLGIGVRQFRCWVEGMR